MAKQCWSRKIKSRQTPRAALEPIGEKKEFLQYAHRSTVRDKHSDTAKQCDCNAFVSISGQRKREQDKKCISQDAVCLVSHCGVFYS
jgi:hypothetical protein